MRDEIVSFDAWRLGMTFGTSLFFFQGEGDDFTVTSESQRFVSDVQAPSKILATIEGGGHSAVFLRDVFLRSLNELVRPVAVGVNH
jgi:hypothetical protein